jgi:hypothetical protein
MKSLKKSFVGASIFDEVLRITLEMIISRKSADPHLKIGYVSGRVTADGEENIGKNLDRLDNLTCGIRKSFDGVVFSAADVFAGEAYWRKNLPRPIHEDEFYIFWQKVVGGGVTDVFMAPGWESSTGAADEHETARMLGLCIHYIDEDMADERSEFP